jgi:anti-anti-sigma factor
VGIPPRHRALAISSRQDGDMVVVSVAGEIDGDTAAQLQIAGEQALHQRPRVLALDLDQVSFLGSAALSALLAVREAAGSATRVRLVATARAVTRVVEITGLGPELQIVGSVDAARAD